MQGHTTAAITATSAGWFPVWLRKQVLIGRGKDKNRILDTYDGSTDRKVKVGSGLDSRFPTQRV